MGGHALQRRDYASPRSRAVLLFAPSWPAGAALAQGRRVGGWVLLTVRSTDADRPGPVLHTQDPFSIFNSVCAWYQSVVSLDKGTGLMGVVVGSDSAVLTLKLLFLTLYTGFSCTNLFLH